MKTPIYDFLEKYNKSNISRLHMPGHKGRGIFGFEKYDLTEISGADSLFEADGIIKESENNASKLFGSKATFYSTEGSSLCIRAMIFSALTNANITKGERPKIVAARNAHKSFIYACAMLDIDIEWVYPENSISVCGGVVNPNDIKSAIERVKPFAVYITSPNYLGEMCDINAISKVCGSVPLLVDNAHGAYLRFLGKHPINNGASMCCDSAHKTLPVLTGGAYLHIADEKYADSIKKSMSLFASTSPSYLILMSLDLCIEYLSTSYENDLKSCIKSVDNIKKEINSIGDEPLKITIQTDGFLADKICKKHKIECEYKDKYTIVFMITPSNNDIDFKRLSAAIAEMKPINPYYIPRQRHISAMTVRDAIFSKSENINIENAIGKICGAPTVSCPPAVPIVMSGEIITELDIELFKKYGIESIDVVKS